MNKGALDKAINDYTEAIRLNPMNATAYYHRGLLYEEKGNLGQAKKDYDDAIRLDPSLGKRSK